MASRSTKRAILVMPAFCLGLLLSGCESFDPTMLIPDSKKPLPGERRAVFPEGVPGVVQGVPPDLIRGRNPAPETQALAPGAGAGPTAAVETAPSAQATEQSDAPAAAPKAKKATAAKRITSIPREQQEAAPPARAAPPPAQQQEQQPAPSAWPAPRPAGTFSR